MAIGVDMAESYTINELLCFMTNKMQNMPANLLTKLICDLYDEKKIETAKQSLFARTASAFAQITAESTDKGCKQKTIKRPRYVKDAVQMRKFCS